MIADGFDRADYAEALLAVGRGPASSLAFGCAMTGKADIRSRITRVLTGGFASDTPLYQRLTAAAAVLAIAVFALAPVRGETVYKVGDNVTVPRILDRTEPTYTEDARQTKVSGTVVLSCVVRPDGMAHDCTVTKGLDPGLDRNAALAIEQWHFAPATKDGEPVAVSVIIEVNFRLQ